MHRHRPLILVSACLAGEACRYDGRPAELAGLKELVETGRALAVCPELLGGLAAPRPPAEIAGGDAEAVLDGRARVVDAEGADVTGPFLKGAQAVLRLARECRATQIILKDRSPSCGATLVYDGSFQGRRIPGQGVTAALLRRNGFNVIGDTGWAEQGLAPCSCPKTRCANHGRCEACRANHGEKRYAVHCNRYASTCSRRSCPGSGGSDIGPGSGAPRRDKG